MIDISGKGKAKREVDGDNYLYFLILEMENIKVGNIYMNTHNIWYIWGR